MHIIKSFPDVDNYVRLFTPSGKKSRNNKWSVNVVDMFTHGYCYNFAKALWMAFRYKYKCTVVGCGNLLVGQASLINRQAIVRAINSYDFNHYMCLIESRKKPNHKCLYDIYGAWDINEDKDKKVLLLDTPKAKLKFKDDMANMSDEEFMATYPHENCWAWRVIYCLSNTDQQKAERCLYQRDIAEQVTSTQ